MKALANRGDGTPAVDLVDIPDPTPQDNEAIVDIAAVGLNRGELRLLSMRDSGWRPGQDVAGVVSSGAPDGSGPGVGTRVLGWPEQAGWAEKVPVPTTRLAVLADGVSASQAAALPIAGMTALRTLRRGGNLMGKSVLITGGSGGVGRFAVELAANQGARVIAVAGTRERAQGLPDLGATKVLHNIRNAKGPFDLILESVGGESLEAAIATVAPHGAIIVFGNSSISKSAVSFSDFVGKPGARIEAFFVYESGEPSSDLQLLADLVAKDLLHPAIGMKGSWREANTALRALQDRQVNGKAILLID